VKPSTPLGPDQVNVIIIIIITEAKAQENKPDELELTELTSQGARAPRGLE
jgi:hypothetical protein